MNEQQEGAAYQQPSDCSGHKKDIAGISDMGQLAEMIGDLHYKTLAELIGRLGTKLYKDGLGDRMAGRNELGYELDDASNKMWEAAEYINKAWHISKPFMRNQPSPTTPRTIAVTVQQLVELWEAADASGDHHDMVIYLQSQFNINPDELK